MTQHRYLVRITQTPLVEPICVELAFVNVRGDVEPVVQKTSTWRDFGSLTHWLIGCGWIRVGPWADELTREGDVVSFAPLMPLPVGYGRTMPTAEPRTDTLVAVPA